MGTRSIVLTTGSAALTIVSALALALTPGCGSEPHTDYTSSDAGTSSTSAPGSSGDSTSSGGAPSTESDGGPGGTTESETTSDTGVEPPTLYCPGDPGGACDELPGAKLMAGASVVSIVPNCFETWNDLNGDFKFVEGQDSFNDCGCDQRCPGDPDYTGPDEHESDNTFQAAWMAGFGNGRAAMGVRKATDGYFGDDDGLWARAVVLEQGNTTFAVVALDVVGWFQDDVNRIRAQLAEGGVDIDYLLVHSTHNHEGRDTMGLWGKKILETGYYEPYQQQVRDAVFDAVKLALADKREVNYMVVGQVDIGDYDGTKGVANLIRDSRDPVVIDEMLSALRLVDGDDETIATLVNFGSHPETLADDNLYLTSDYVHALRRAVEKGSQWLQNPGKPGFGGVCVFLNGAVGGMMTTLGVEVTTPDGLSYSSASFEKADAIGQLLGEAAIDSINDGVAVQDPKLELAAQEFTATLENAALKLMYETGIIDRTQCPDELTGPDSVCTEMALIRVGPLEMLSVPGELLPELAIGGYDGSHVGSPVYDFIDPNNPNPPDVDSSPDGPYLKERMAGDFRWIIGLGNDELGYIVPEYDFQLASNAYFDEAPGDHYEETNSLGPATAARIDEIASTLTAWSQRE
ncbi:MAG: hypothetical protein H6713_28330 [Myxococcales bacterium]|nr:hypothetical protein [Myxococcales bacterium]MCB9753869.1 hypothetical protein [Myxococcales bacterium]